MKLRLTARDLERFADAIALLCELALAAGAVEVYPGVAGVPEVVTTVDEARAIRARRLRGADFRSTASHLFGGACAGVDPARTVVGPDLQSHEVRDLYVVDASAFPSNLGVNPQHSIMALSFRASERLAAEVRSRAAG